MGLFETAKSNAESFMKAIKELINSASFNKSFRATVTEKINNTVYKVSYKNAEYKVKSYYNLLVGDTVWVCAPGNDWDSLFVQSYNGFHDRVITTDKVVNNLTTNVADTVLDGRMGKSLNDKIVMLNNNLSNVSSTVTKIHDLSSTDYVTNFNGGGNAILPGRWRVYNESGTAANAPYSGAVSGYVEIVTNGNTTTNGTRVWQALYDHNGDVYTKVITTGSSYGTWKKLTP